MHKGSTLLLKIAVLLFGGAVLILCFFLIRTLLTEDIGGYFPILIGMLIAAIPFYIGAYQTLNLLNLIDNKEAFTERSVDALNKIKYCGIAVSVLYGLGMPYIFIVAERDDAPGVILLGIIFTLAPLAIAVFSGLFQKVINDAINLKNENELTV